MNELDYARRRAATQANAQDGELWRWFSLLMDERRIRWCQADGCWIVSVDHRHVATETSFDRAIREARGVCRMGQSRRRAAIAANHASGLPCPENASSEIAR
jgi:hypothetical protein